MRVHRDLALGPFYREVTEFCSSKLHSEADMAIVVILSHGQVGTNPCEVNTVPLLEPC